MSDASSSGLDDDDERNGVPFEPLDKEQLKELRELFEFFATIKQTKNNNIVLKKTHHHNHDEEENDSDSGSSSDDEKKTSMKHDEDSLVISVSNLHALFNSMGLLVPEEKVQTIINQHTQHNNNSDGITFAEFLVFYCNLTKTRSNAYEMKEVFRLLDDDDDGFVEVYKLKHVIKGMFPEYSNHQVLDILTSAYPQDAELQQVSFREFYKHGRLNYDGFVRFLFSDVQHSSTQLNQQQDQEKKKKS